ncbi:MAG: hypothetical protein NUW22_04860 [Acidobacteria bacterium]|nr:hypothetical protein [Acidobacteriota bacterium]
MVTIQTVLIIAAMALSFVEVFKSKGTSALAWACLCLSVALLLPRIG